MRSSDPKLPPAEAEVPATVRNLAPLFGADVEIEIWPAGPASGPDAVPDFLVDVAWAGASFRFAAEYKRSSEARALDAAIQQARRWAAASSTLPMVIVPYLSEPRVDRLLLAGVSGLDLCGNGLVAVPGRVLLRRTGQPNRYSESRPARFAYSGATALVPRVFLRKPAYRSVSEVLDEIRAAGGSVALSTVSKALARMADDLIIDRDAEGIRLLQADKLLAALADGFSPVKPTRTARGRATAPLVELFKRVSSTGGGKPGNAAPLVMSGASSQDQYAAGMRADSPTLYCRDLDAVRAALQGAWQPTDRYADMVFLETNDPTPFFDARPDAQGVVGASPVQTYLELERGEKRDQELARQVRDVVLREAAGHSGAAA